jgi:hypothetical protein
MMDAVGLEQRAVILEHALALFAPVPVTARHDRYHRRPRVPDAGCSPGRPTTATAVSRPRRTR